MRLAAAFWVSVALMLGGMAAIVLWSAPQIEAGGLAPFDSRSSGYSHADAVRFLTALTPDGRAAYLGPQRLADTIFPIGLFGTLALGSYLGVRRWSRGLALGAVLVPLGYFLCDMFEGVAVAGLLRTNPDAVTVDAVARASAFTVWKFYLVDAALVLVALAWGARGIDALRRRTR